MTTTLSVAIVTYAPDMACLTKTVDHLVAAINTAQQRNVLDAASIRLVDNGPGPDWARRLTDAVTQATAGSGIASEVISGHGNVGYGRGNNLALAQSAAEYHLVLNPDVDIYPDALVEALTYMRDNASVSLLAPAVLDEHQGPGHLCRRYPTVAALALRGFCPRRWRRRWEGYMSGYEMRDMDPGRPNPHIEIASGCFMLCRTDRLRAVGGFSPAYFLYFEDYDLSMRIRRTGSIAFVPTVRIAHHGGMASRKGGRHILWFATSALRFFARHGWKWR